MKDYIEEKLGRLDKYLENSENVRANVIAKVNGHQQTMEITIPLKSFILRSEETQEDFYAPVDKTIDNLKGVGEVKIHGEKWSAITENDGEIIEQFLFFFFSFKKKIIQKVLKNE